MVKSRRRKPKPEDFGVTWNEVSQYDSDHLGVRQDHLDRLGLADVGRTYEPPLPEQTSGPKPQWPVYLIVAVIAAVVIATVVTKNFGFILVPWMVLGGAFISAVFISKAFVSVSALLTGERQKVEAFLTELNRYDQRKKQRELKKAERERERRRKQAEYWQGLSGREFEEELCNLFRKAGYKAQLTPATDDAGIDINLTKDDKTIIVQCKRHDKPVGPAVARDVYGALMDAGSDEAIIASVAGFTAGVHKFVSGKPIVLLDVEGILQMQDEYGAV